MRFVDARLSSVRTRQLFGIWTSLLCVLVLANISAVVRTQPSSLEYPRAQYKGDSGGLQSEFRHRRWNHMAYPRGPVSLRRRGGPFGMHKGPWEEHTTLDPLSRFHYPGMRISRHRRPMRPDDDPRQQNVSPTTTTDPASSENEFAQFMQRRKVLRPRRPPVIPLNRDETDGADGSGQKEDAQHGGSGGRDKHPEMAPFRYSTNNGNYRQPPRLQWKHPGGDGGSTTEGTTTGDSRSEETTETKSYIGLPGYWKPIRVPPYGYNYPRWYHVQRTKEGVPIPNDKERDDEQQSIEEGSSNSAAGWSSLNPSVSVTTNEPETSGSSSSNEGDPSEQDSTTTEQAAQHDLGLLNFRPHMPPTYPTRFPDYSFQPGLHRLTAGRNGFHPQGTRLPPEGPSYGPSAFSSFSPQGRPMDYQTWLQQNHAMMSHLGEPPTDSEHEVTTSSAPQIAETTSISPHSQTATVPASPTMIFPTPTPSPTGRPTTAENSGQMSMDTATYSPLPYRPSPTPSGSATQPSPITTKPIEDAGPPPRGLSTSETSTFYTNAKGDAARNPQSGSYNSEPTFIGPVRHHRPATVPLQPHEGYHHLQQQNSQSSELSEEQQRSASQLEGIRSKYPHSEFPAEPDDGFSESPGLTDEHERLRAGEVAGMIIGIVSLIATLVGCVTFLVLKKPLAASEEPAYPSPEPPVTSLQRTFSGGVGGAMFVGDVCPPITIPVEGDCDGADDDEERGSPPPTRPLTHASIHPVGHHGPPRKGTLMQPIPEWSYSPASSIRLSFDEVHQAVQGQRVGDRERESNGSQRGVDPMGGRGSKAPSRAELNVTPEQREPPARSTGYI